MNTKRGRTDEIETVARSLLEYVRENGQNGNWVAASAAFKHAIEKHSKLEWVLYIRRKPRGKMPMTRAIKQLMHSDFADIQREKRGHYRSAPVFFRVKIK